MSGATVEVDSLRVASRALDDYVEMVSRSVQNLRSNANECKELMQGDVLSTKAAERLDTELTRINQALTRAGEIKGGIEAKIRDIEATKEIFGGN